MPRALRDRVPAPADEGASTALSAGRYDSFVVRVFSDARTGTFQHGEVTHVATRRKHHFTDLRSATAFMLAQVGQHQHALNSPEHD
jgi:hypothetical protein